jgi:hypothetical protein
MIVPDLELTKFELGSQAVKIQDRKGYERAGEVLVRVVTAIKILRDGDQTILHGGLPWMGLDVLVASAKATYDQMLQQRKFFLDRWEKVRAAYEKEMEKYRLEKEAFEHNLVETTKAAAVAAKARLERAAKKALLAGDPEEAALLESQKDLISDDPQITQEDFRLPGIAQAEEYDIEITDIMALLNAVATGKVPTKGLVQKKEYDLFEVRLSVIQSYVKSMGDAFDWPGVKITKKISYRPRAVK